MLWVCPNEDLAQDVAGWVAAKGGTATVDDRAPRWQSGWMFPARWIVRIAGLTWKSEYRLREWASWDPRGQGEG